MFLAAALALADLSPALADARAPLYPPLERVREISHHVALAVAMEAQRSGLAEKTSRDEVELRIVTKSWSPDHDP
jgi:malate dehydrogenase (oxaloacetate-decarboxylating)